MMPTILLNSSEAKKPWKSLKWNLGISQLTLTATVFQHVLTCPLDMFWTDGLLCATQAKAKMIDTIACSSKWECVWCVGGSTVCLSIICKVFNPSDGLELVSHIDSIHTNTLFKSFLRQTAYTTAQNQSYHTNPLKSFYWRIWSTIVLQDCKLLGGARVSFSMSKQDVSYRAQGSDTDNTTLERTQSIML